MRAHIDTEVDAFVVRWGDHRIVESDEVEPGIILDYDEDGNVIGVEILDFSKNVERLTPVMRSVASPAEPVEHR